MRSTFFMKILDRVTIPLDTNFNETVNRLMAQNGDCRLRDTQREELEFYCNQKGHMWVYEHRGKGWRYSPQVSDNEWGRKYYVRGEVRAEGSKSSVTVYTVYNRSTVLLRWISVIGDIALLVTYILLLCLGDATPTAFQLLPMAALIALLFPLIIHGYKEEQHKDEDIEIMKTEMLNRIEAVKRWNE